MQLREDELATARPSPPTTTTTANTILARISRAQAQVVQLTEDLPEATLRWHVEPHAPAMRFHLWHLARWADKLQSSLTGLTADLQQRLEPTAELWATESLAARWGLTPGQLGDGDTGMGLDDDLSAALPLPDRDELIAYARHAFAAADQRLAVIGDADLAAGCTDLYGNPNVVCDVLLSHLGHVNRHLGMLEALRGVQGSSGTATW